jgi:hypothetical protein
MKSIAYTIFACLVLAVSMPQAAASENVKALVAKKASILSKMHKKARKALVNAAQDHAYSEFAAHEHGTADAKLKAKVDEVSLAVQARFHVEEMCLIAADGKELARVVRQSVADDLSQDETGANFFAPGFALKPREAFISPVYMSPDALKIVVAYVTPVVVEGKNKAILHYEQGLEVYQDALNKDLDGAGSFLVAVNEDGRVVSDSRDTVAVKPSGDEEDLATYLPPFQFGDQDLAGVMRIARRGKTLAGPDGKAYAVASKKVERWTLLAFAAQ